MAFGDLKTAIRVTASVALAVAFLSAAPSAAETGFPDISDRAAIGRVVHAVCGKRIVILGEASHSDGHSDSAKVELVEHLVRRCGFNGVLFEASAYEFVPISRAHEAGKPITADNIGSAVGGLWKFDQEVQPLFGFLADNVNAGKVVIAGLDFQAGGVGQPYSNEGMIAELALRLPTNRRDFCRAAYAAHVLGADSPAGVTAEDLPSALRACFAEMRTSLSGDDNDARIELDNLSAWVTLSEQGFGPMVIGRKR